MSATPTNLIAIGPCPIQMRHRFGTSNANKNRDSLFMLSQFLETDRPVLSYEPQTVDVRLSVIQTTN